MKITDLKIDGFGIWNRLQLSELSDQLIVLYGPNEAGKTTLMQFIRALLYGFDDPSRQSYLPPVAGGAAGGRMHVQSGREHLEIVRTANDYRDLGEVQVLCSDGAAFGQSRLDGLLSGLDESVYNNVFAVGLREMQQLGSLNDTEAAEQLYALSSGLDRVSLVEVLRELKTSRQRLLNEVESTGEIANLLTQREKLLDRLEQCRDLTRRWSQLAAEKETLTQQITQIQQSTGTIENRSKGIELASRLRLDWQRREQLNQQLLDMGPLPELPPGALERIDSYSQGITRRERRCREVRERWGELRDEAQALPINRSLWQQAARIEALGEQRQWIASIESQITSLQRDVEDDEARLSGRLNAIGLSGNQGDLAELTPRKLSILRGPAKEVRMRRQQFETAQQDVESLGVQSQQLAEDAELALIERGYDDLPTALEGAGELVSSLRRRQQVESRIEQLQRNTKECEARRHRALHQQVIPMWALGGIGAVVVLSIVLILVGMFGGMFAILGTIGWPLAVLGVMGLGAAVATKVIIERSAAKRVVMCTQQSDLLEVQARHAKAELRDIDAQLPQGGGPMSKRLADAEKELATLEELLPLDGQRQSSQQQAQAATHRVAVAEEAFERANDKWKQAVLTLGLPESVTPQQVKQMVSQGREMGEGDLSARRRRDELEARQREWAGIEDRIERLSKDAGLQRQGEPAMLAIDRLSSALGQQQQYVERRDSLKKQAKRLRREHAKTARKIQRLKWKRRALISSADAVDERQFRNLASRLSEAESVRAEKDAISRQINSSITGVCTEQQLGEIICQSDHVALRQEADSLLNRLADSEQQLRRCYTRSGELNAQMDALADDRRVLETKFELNFVEQKLADATDRWQVLAVTSHLLEAIRHIYETERQPEALAEASKHLERLTRGKYTRVWTPLGEDLLKVDDADGHPLPLEVLSRGTREQVFLSLRLALVSCYAKRGIVLPLVLDDVLVNFDAGRALAAAEVMHDFANAGHQLIVFTCHEHMKEMFMQLGVEVRDLPTRDGQQAVLEVEKLQTPIVVEDRDVEVIEEEVEEEVDEPIEAEEECEEECEEEEDEMEEEDEEEEDLAEEDEYEEEEEDEYEEEEVAEDDDDEYEEEDEVAEEDELDGDDEAELDEESWDEEEDAEDWDDDGQEAA